MRKSNLTKIAFAAICTASIIACKPVVKTHSADYDVMYITKSGIIQKPMITDLEVASKKETITKTYQNVSSQSAKEAALADFVKQFACDIIVQPYFVTNTITKDEKSEITVTLTGYPANYKNIRNFEPKDTASFLPSRFRF